MKLRAALLIALLSATPAWAVQPDEVLADPALEARARSISEGLRCLVCRNETIDDSDASLARDLRLLLRERLTAGDTDADAIAFIVDRYGEYVLLNPTANGVNLILWLAGPAMLIAGLATAALYLRRRRTSAAPDAPLSDGETKRLAEILEN
ncbi:MAG: cytochrome c-type biogenesis protein CcmH [Rhodoferax sp.]|nr:cytochrome c-type biogenesis protein CcmH [Pseudorhodobacter sp.]